VRYRFGEYELDASSHRLIRGGAAVRVWPKVFDVLRYLVEQRGRTVSKQELLDTLWTDSHVDEVAVPWTISHARRALGQKSGDKAPIETVHGRGYCFTADVEVLEDRAPSSTSAPSVFPAAESALAQQPFVGRDAAMQQLQARLTETRAGHGGLCVLSGPAGIGKTRCVDELSTHATQQRFVVVAGRCVEDAWAPVYWPWIQIVRQLVRDQPSLAAAGDALLTRLGGMERGTGEGEDSPQTSEANFWWIDGVSQLLLGSSRVQPTMVVLDDVHWADAATLDLLAFLAPDLRTAPLLIVATQRDGREVLHPRALQRLSRHADRIALSALSVQDVGDYLRLVTHEPVNAELQVAVHVATAGNPLFLQQTVRSLVASHGEAGLASLSVTDVKPASIAHDVLGASLRVLSAETRELLSLASVLGESFPVSLLQEFSGHAIEDLLGLLESARDEGLLIAEEPIALRFCHALLRAVLYEALPNDKRVTLHRRVAEILERSGASARDGEIAHHYYASLPLGDAPRVTAAVLRAARSAARMNAFADANRYCDWARTSQALDTDAQPRQRAELWLFSAQMQSSAGHAEDAQQSINALIAIARPHRFHDLLVRAARVLRHTPLMGAIEDSMARQILEDALDHASNSTHSSGGGNRLKVEALSMLSWIPPYALDLERSKELSAQALELARELGDETLELRALNARLYALSGPDDIDALLATVDEMLARSSVPTGWVVAAALGARYSALLHRGDMALADQTCAELGHAAHTHQWPAAIWYHERLIAQRRFLDGDFQATATAVTELREQGRRLRVSYASTLVDVLQGLLVLETQGPALIAQMAPEDQIQSGLETGPISVRPSIARLSLSLGDRDGAAQVLHTLSANNFANVPKELGYLHALCNLAVLAIELDDRPRAETLYDLLTPYAHFNTPNVLLYYEGSVSHFLGMLAAYLKRDDLVETHFENALAMNEKLSQRPQLARTCKHYAAWLVTRNTDSARKRAESLQARAVEHSRLT